MALHEMVAAELAAARARREVESLDRAARIALRECGWDTNPATLELWLERLKPARSAAVLRRALELQRETTGSEKRYTPDEIEAYMATKRMPRERADEIRAYVAQLRKADTHAQARDVLHRVNEHFGVRLSLDNLYQSYWGKKPKQTRQPAQPAACAPTTGFTTAPAAAPAAGPSANGAAPAKPPETSSHQPTTMAGATNRPVTLGPITVIFVRSGVLRIAVDYEGPAQTVYAIVAAAAAVLAEREAA